MGTEQDDFNELLLLVIDETLSSLGESVRQSIYFHIENKFSINSKEISGNLQEFQEELEKIFGTGARFIEVLIIKNLYIRIGCPLIIKKNEQLEFTEYMGAAKQIYLRNVTKQASETQPSAPFPLPTFMVSVSKP